MKVTNKRDEPLNLRNAGIFPWWHTMFKTDGVDEQKLSYITFAQLHQTYGLKFVAICEMMLAETSNEPTAERLERFLQDLMKKPNLKLHHVQVSRGDDPFVAFSVNVGYTE